MSTTKQPQRKLPADVYDYLELAALAFGGIGGSNYLDSVYVLEDPEDPWGVGIYVTVPVCAIGFAHLLDDGSFERGEQEVVENALREAGINEEENDEAVERINRRRGKWADERVTFKAWVKELNVVRGGK